MTTRTCVFTVKKGLPGADNADERKRAHKQDMLDLAFGLTDT